MDGTLQQDLPFQRLTELFNAQCFVVSQVNPHVTPFVSNQPKQHGHSHGISLLSQLELHLQADISHRLRRLVAMKVIPRVYGQDWSGMIDGQQRYSGDITIVPQLRYRMVVKALQHPSRAVSHIEHIASLSVLRALVAHSLPLSARVQDMDEYIRGGETATWARLSQVQNSLLIERTLEQCVKAVSASLRTGEQVKGAGGGRNGNVSGDESFGFSREQVSLHELIRSDGSVNLNHNESPPPTQPPPAAQASPVSRTTSEVSNDWGEADLQAEMSLLMTPITSPAARETGKMRRAVSDGANTTERKAEEDFTPRRRVRF